MGAPNTEYFLIDNKFRGSNNIEMIVNPARANADLATIKARFYLDDVIGIMVRDLNGNYYHGFFGMVLPSGFNYRHHNPARLLEINGPKPGQVLRTFNDAGLNTLGDATDLYISHSNVVKIELAAAFHSSYFAESDSFGIRWWLPETPDNKRILSFSYSIPKGQSVSDSLPFPLDDSDLVNLKAGDIIYSDAWINNEEGTFYSDSTQIYIEPVGFEFKYHPSSPASAYNGSTQILVFIAKRDIDVGTQFYSEVSMVESSRLPAGYYLQDTQVYEVRANANNQMLVTGMGNYNPVEVGGEDPNYIMYHAYNDSGTNSPYNSCARFRDSNPNIFIFYRLAADRYFSGVNSSRPISDGYYVLDSEGRWIKTINGYKVEEGYC